MLEVKIVTEGLTDKENAYIECAAKRMEYVLNHEKFKEWCLNYSYDYVYSTGRLWWKKTFKEHRICFANNQGLTNYQVYNKIMSGAETLDPDLDEQADIYIKVDRSNKRGVIGYTYPNTKWQWIYHWVLDSWSINSIAGNLSHEWCHKIGFDHDFSNTPIRPFSVPYAVGSFVAGFKY
jgi:hypothetical protein